MINKKNLLGKVPEILGYKDAIHVAIVAVRAAGAILPGQRVGLNEHREAVADKENGLGVADPFLKTPITRGQVFWLMLNQDEVPNVRHVWEHPSADFTPPQRSVLLNRAIGEAVELFGVSCEQIMKAAAHVVKEGEAIPYPGPLSREAFESAYKQFDNYDFFSEWSDEASHKFYNNGTECCPEYNYPTELFSWPVANPTRETL